MKKILVKKNFGRKKILCQKKNVVGKKIFGIIKIWRKKLPGTFFGSKKIFVRKKNFSSQIVFGPKFFLWAIKKM